MPGRVDEFMEGVRADFLAAAFRGEGTFASRVGEVISSTGAGISMINLAVFWTTVFADVFLAGSFLGALASAAGDGINGKIWGWDSMSRASAFFAGAFRAAAFLTGGGDPLGVGSDMAASVVMGMTGSFAAGAFLAAVFRADFLAGAEVGITVGEGESGVFFMPVGAESRKAAAS